MSTRDVYVHDFSLSLGAHDFSLEESVAAARTHSGAHALSEAGFRRHRVARADQTSYDLARAAVTHTPLLTAEPALAGKLLRPDLIRQV